MISLVIVIVSELAVLVVLFERFVYYIWMHFSRSAVRENLLNRICCNFDQRHFITWLLLFSVNV